MNYEFALLCSSPSWGGLEMNFFKWSLWAKELNYQCLTFIDEKTTLRTQFELFPQIQTEIFKRSLKKMDILAAHKLSKRFQKLNIHKVLVTSTIDLDLACWIKFFYPKLVITYVQQMQLGVVKKNLYFNWKYKNINHWICPLPWLKSQLLSMTNLREDQIHLHPLPIDTKAWRVPTPDEKLDAKRSLELAEDSLVFGLVGRIDPGKRQKLVLTAFIELLHKRPELKSKKITLVFVGNTTLSEKTSVKYLEELKQIVQQHQLSLFVRFLPHRANPLIVYQGLDFFVMATPKESFGMVTLEALASGLEVIGPNDGGTKDLLANGKWGHLFLPDNISSLASAMEKVLTTKSDVAGRLDYLATFDYRYVLKDYFNYFRPLEKE
jgi:D-inositol-3-phosphate glycosyltransferase